MDHARFAPRRLAARGLVPALLAGAALLLSACSGKEAPARERTASTLDSTAAAPAPAPRDSAAPEQPVGPATNLPPNELGRFMVLEYHRLGDNEGEWYRSEQHYREDLQKLYQNGYRPVTMRQILSGDIDIPRGTTPVVFVMDDSSLGQFYFLPDGDVDPHTMMGIWTAFQKRTGWKNGGVWCVLPGAEYPSNFWGAKKSKEVPKAQREAEIQKKVTYAIQHGHEICNHTMWHANLGKYPDAFVQDQIGSGQDSIMHYLPADYRIVTFALPLGVWPKNKPLAWHGTYRNGKTYDYEAVLEVSGGPNHSPFDSRFDPHHVTRIISQPGALDREIEYFEQHPDERYVSDGAPNVISVPKAMAGQVDRGRWKGKEVRVTG
ncbi:MAG TPA: polysaccharide deacetylase family protein [Longimicrobiaceae bacterium]|nr:polysaccharide deacetylase family protein [Longimicrobiaceae bacterium]